jgi:hypothetical protein
MHKRVGQQNEEHQLCSRWIVPIEVGIQRRAGSQEMTVNTGLHNVVHSLIKFGEELQVEKMVDVIR